MHLQDVQETRRHKRCGVEIACEVITDRSEHAAQLRCIDLSRRGALIESGIAPQVGELVVVSFRPPGRESPLTLFARVKHVMKRGWAVHGFGVEFERPSIYESRVLQDALRGAPAQQASEHAA